MAPLARRFGGRGDDAPGASVEPRNVDELRRGLRKEQVREGAF